MISSTARDLPQHREKVMDACMRLGVFYPDMMEHLTATDANALEISLAIADRADVYIGIIGFRYGYVPDGKVISVTEAEYNRALELNTPRLIFLMSDKHPLLPADVETGDGAEKLKKFKERLQKDRVVSFFDSADDLKAKVIQALVPYCKPPELSSGPQPVIHTLPTQLDIEGREAECATILRAMSEAKHRVYAFAAPGGFGKTALLTKVVQTLSPDGQSVVEKVSLPDGTIETHTSALLHVDCRNDIKLSELFAKAGRLIGQEKQFEDIYNTDGSLTDKLQEIFGRLSTNPENRTWFMFDNFESMLNDKSEVVDPQLRDFFSSVFSGGHNVRALIVGRDVPRFSPREQVKELETVGGNLFGGLPVNDCVSFLKKNGAAKGLNGSGEQVDAVLKEFSERVHRIPLALVWAIGYLVDTAYTVREILDRPELFADFDEELTKAADRYENKGLKRLHLEQLKIQPAESLPSLGLLAFFKRTGRAPGGPLAHLLDEVQLNKTLTRLERNKLVTMEAIRGCLYPVPERSASNESLRFASRHLRERIIHHSSQIKKRSTKPPRKNAGNAPMPRTELTVSLMRWKSTIVPRSCTSIWPKIQPGRSAEQFRRHVDEQGQCALGPDQVGRGAGGIRQGDSDSRAAGRTRSSKRIWPTAWRRRT